VELYLRFPVCLHDTMLRHKGNFTLSYITDTDLVVVATIHLICILEVVVSNRLRNIGSPKVSVSSLVSDSTGIILWNRLRPLPSQFAILSYSKLRCLTVEAVLPISSFTYFCSIPHSAPVTYRCLHLQGVRSAVVSTRSPCVGAGTVLYS